MIHQVYIAGSYAARDALRARANQLMSRGVIVTSNWLWWEPPDVLVNDPDKLDAAIAHLDWHGVATADALIIDTDVASTKGGFHVELGLAVAWRKPVLHVGSARPNAFYIYSAAHYSTWDELITKYDELRQNLIGEDLSKLREAESGEMPTLGDVEAFFKSLNQNQPPTNTQE